MSPPEEPEPEPRFGDYRDRLAKHPWPGWPLTTTEKTAGARVITSPGVERPAIYASRAGPALTTMGEIMLADEALAGRNPIMPDNAPRWFDPNDWAKWPVLSIGGGELYIVAIESARKGALHRLLDAARKAHLTPVIVSPMGQIMPGLVRRWGWTCTVVGEGLDRREEWRP